MAIAGTNGSGKSTILKAVAAAYLAEAGSDAKAYSPDDFFPNTPWENVMGVSLTYTIREGTSTKNITVRKPTHRWRGALDRVKRPSFFLDISRVQPANTQIGYGRTAQEAISVGSPDPLDGPGVSQLSRVLGRTYSAARLDRIEGKQIGVLEHSGLEYSNFHQGAGEDSVLDLVSLLRKAPDKSLVVIDEVEASLHPRAQRGLMTELLRLAHDKKLQVILSTHSPFILEQLPPIARVLVEVDRDGGRRILYGVSSEFALNKMDDERHYELDVFCEDPESAYIVERILALGAPDALQRVRITGVGPAGTVMSLAAVASQNKLARPAICVLDGDQDADVNCELLPGMDAPEIHVVNSLSASNWTAVAERLGCPLGDLLNARDSAVMIPNHHAWTGEIARSLGGSMHPRKVWEALVDVWTIDVLGSDAAAEWSDAIVEALA